jgi:hypothetical protein
MIAELHSFAQIYNFTNDFFVAIEHIIPLRVLSDVSYSLISSLSSVKPAHSCSFSVSIIHGSTSQIFSNTTGRLKALLIKYT